MKMIVILAIVTALTIAAYTDLKTREVPDWLNFGMIATGFGLRLLLSTINWKVSFILEGIYGFVLGMILAYLMFYSGQWGGGDSKTLMGLGALIGLQLTVSSLFVSFLINLLFIGAIYGLMWSIGLAIKHRKEFTKQMREYTGTRLFRRMRFTVIMLVAVCLIIVFLNQDRLIKLLFIILAAFSFLMLYLWAFVKVVEQACMLKLIEPKKLTEGDWIAKPVFIGKKYVTGPKDLGITKKQIAILRKNTTIKRVLVKEGIPFVPSFLLAFIVTLICGNLILLFLAV